MTARPPDTAPDDLVPPPGATSRHAQSDDASARLLGMLLLSLGWLAFSGIDGSAKYMSGFLPVVQIVFLRYSGALVYCAALVTVRGVSRPLATQAFWMQMLRGVLLVASTGLNFFSLRYLQLDQTSAIMFAVPLIVCALSVPLLGEQVGWRRWSAVGVGLAGVMVIVRPGFEGFHWAMLLVVLNAFLAALYFLFTRKVTARDRDETSLIYSVLIGTAITLPFAVAAWQPITGWVILPAILIGLFGGIGHHLIVVAHRLAPAPVIAPFSYTHIIWMTALGYVLFGHVPDTLTAAGAAIIVASGLFLIARERRKKPAASAAVAAVKRRIGP